MICEILKALKIWEGLVQYLFICLFSLCFDVDSKLETTAIYYSLATSPFFFFLSSTVFPFLSFHFSLHFTLPGLPLHILKVNFLSPSLLFRFAFFSDELFKFSVLLLFNRCAMSLDLEVISFAGIFYFNNSVFCFSTSSFCFYTCFKCTY